MFKKYQRHVPPSGKVETEDLARVQEMTEEVFKEITDRGHLASNLLEGLELETGSTQLVEHKLGRQIRGWKVTDVNAAATFHRDTASDADLSLYLPLVVSANVTCSLEVF